MATKILTHEEISLKLDRIAWQILENHHQEKKIILVGLDKRGASVVSKICDRLKKFGAIEVQNSTISVNKKDPLGSPVILTDSASLSNQAVVLVDDVLNSGKIMAAALKEILNHNPKSIKTAVLANRDHHKYPIQANYVGISLATTLMEHITYSEVDGKMSVELS